MTETITREAVATVPSAALHKALTYLRTIVPKRGQLATILGNVVVQGTGDEITLTAFDYETHAKVRVPSSSPFHFDATLVDFAGFADAVKSHKRGKAAESTVERTDDGLRVAQNGTSRMLPVDFDMDDYPAAPEFTGHTFTLSADTLSEIVAHVAPVAGVDDLLPVLTVIRLQRDGSTLTAAATDRFRLAYMDGKTTHGAAIEALVPASVLRSLAKFSTVDYSVTVGSNNITFSGGDVLMSTRLVEGSFPKVAALLPSIRGEHSVAASADDLIDALSALGRTKVAVMVSEGGKFRVETNDGDAHTTAEVNADVSDDFRVAFNPALALPVLRSLRGHRVEFTGDSTTRPFEVHSDGKPNTRTILMPVREAA